MMKMMKMKMKEKKEKYYSLASRQHCSYSYCYYHSTKAGRELHALYVLLAA